jgi:hypothetical protein
MKAGPSDNVVRSIGFHAGTAAIALLISLCFLHRAVGATVNWTNAGGDELWSTASNWSGGLPSGNDVVFTNTGASLTPSATTSLLDTSYSVNSLTFDNMSGNSQFLYLQQSGANLNISGALTVASGGTASLGGAGSNTITAAGGVSVNNGNLNISSGATLAVTSGLVVGESGGAGSLNLAPGAGLQVGTPAQPIWTYVGYASSAGTFVVDSTVNPNVSLNFSTLYLGYGDGSFGTMDLTKFTGPISVQDLEVGGSRAGLGRGQFTFGNATLNYLAVPTVQITNGSVNVNSGATLAVTSEFVIGQSGGVGSLNLAPSAGLQIGTPTQSIVMYVGYAGSAGTFAVDSTANPNVSLNLSTLYIGYGTSSSGTVDLSKFTGSISVQDLEVGGNFNGVGSGQWAQPVLLAL